MKNLMVRKANKPYMVSERRRKKEQQQSLISITTVVLTVQLRWILIWPHNLMEYNLLDESFYCELTTNHPANENITKHKIVLEREKEG